MRFSILTIVLASFAAMSYAQVDPTEESVALNARELLEDLGMHARALKGAALSARRIDELEARMLDMEDDLQELFARKKVKSDAYVCPKCDATFDSVKGLNSHMDLEGHHSSVAPANRRRTAKRK